MRLTRISLALKRSRSSATTAAQAAPPSAPASMRSGKKSGWGMATPAVVTHSASPPPPTAPMRNCPSAPMFQTLER